MTLAGNMAAFDDPEGMVMKRRGDVRAWFEG